MSRLFIVGNGLDLSHNLPTKFNPDFKNIAEYHEQSPYFWDLYQSREANIWADFENLLAHTDFNSLEEIFEGYQPEFLSDHESDRDTIIAQVDLNGNLRKSLYAFAEQAECQVENSQPISTYTDLFTNDGLFVSVNYTHTLEKVYGVPKDRVLHVHGEVGLNNLILGYPEGTFSPEKYKYDVRQKGRGPYREMDIREHIENMVKSDSMDYYTYTAFERLIDKTESFKKVPQIQLLEQFIFGAEITEIIVLGHSCAIDFPYFDYLNKRFTQANWMFNAFDKDTRMNIDKLAADIGIRRYQISA